MKLFTENIKKPNSKINIYNLVYNQENNYHFSANPFIYGQLSKTTAFMVTPKTVQVYSNTRVQTQVNTSQRESTRIKTSQHGSAQVQHKSTRVQHKSTHIITSPARVNTNQHESDKNQHESNTSQHTSIRPRNYHSLP